MVRLSTIRDSMREFFQMEEMIGTLTSFLKRKKIGFKHLSQDQFNRALISAIYNKPLKKQKEKFPHALQVQDIKIIEVKEIKEDVIVVSRDLSGIAVMSGETFEKKMKGIPTEEAVYREERKKPNIHKEMPERDVTNYLFSTILVPEKKKTIRELVAHGGAMTMDQLGDLFDYYKDQDKKEDDHKIKIKQKQIEVNFNGHPVVELLLRSGIEPNPGPIMIHTVFNGQGKFSMDMTNFPHWEKMEKEYKSARLISYRIAVYGKPNVAVTMVGHSIVTRNSGMYHHSNQDLRLVLHPEYEHIRDEEKFKSYAIESVGEVDYWTIYRTFELVEYTRFDGGHFMFREFNVKEVEEESSSDYT